MKKLNPRLIAAALMLALPACQPLTAEYTASEAPKNLTLDNATGVIGVRFAPGSSRLLPADAARLRTLAASGVISPSDRVTVSAAGSPGLAAARFHAIASTLVGYDVVAGQRAPVATGPNQAIIETGRYLVTLPPCPNWSKVPSTRFSNAYSSNFGCADVVDLALSVASPADLAEGRPVGLAAGQPAAAAVNRYLNDKVQLPSAVSGLGPLTTTATPSPGGAAGAGSQP